MSQDQERSHVSHFYEWLWAGLAILLVPWTILLTPIGPDVLVQLGKDVAYVTFISHVALILALIASWQGARAEIKADEPTEIKEKS